MSGQEFATKYDFQLLDQKMDMQYQQLSRMAEAIESLVEVEKSQLTQGMRIGNLETAVAKLQTKQDTTKEELDKWVQRGVGLWASLVIVCTVGAFAVSQHLIVLGSR